MLIATAVHAQSLPTNITTALEKIEIGANDELLVGAADDALLREFFLQNISSLGQLAISLNENRLDGIFVRAAVKYLSVNDYLTFSGAVFNHITNGELSPKLGLPVLYPAVSDKEGVLAVNYNDRRIAEVLPKVLSRYADNPQKTNFIQKLVSGKAKKEHIDWCEAQGLTPAKVVAEVPSKTSPPPSSPNLLPSPPKKAPETKLTTSTPSEEPTSSTPWSIIVGLVVVMVGSLWLLFKARK